ncbi:MAG: ATP phosphoribosyltransferase, partial [Myxococcota bacterium]
MTHSEPPLLRLALPKGRMKDSILQLLRDAGVNVRLGARTYRPSISLDNVDVKMLKPRNVVEMLHVGTRDVGFAGADLVQNLDEVCLVLLDKV